MHIGVLFHNVGGYHAARLRATQKACEERGWRLSAIQVTSQTGDHPWGDLTGTITFPLTTLLPLAQFPEDSLRLFESRVSIPRLYGTLSELQLDALAIPGWGFAISRAALRWCRQQGVATILMSESKWDDAPRRWWKEWWKSVRYVRQFDGALVGGEMHRDYLVQLGMDPARIFLGYDVVDNRHFAQGVAIARTNPSAIRQRHSGIPARPYFLAVTRLISRKNVVRLVQAYARYRQTLCDRHQLDAAWDLVICGSGSEEVAIRQMIRQNGLQDCVHLPGFIGYSQLPAWYGLASAFIHPALQDQWGLVVNEACASGLPILCSETVGAATLVNPGENGLLFAPEDEGAIAQVLLQLHELPSERRVQWGRTSQTLISRHTPQQFADGLMKALSVCLPLAAPRQPAIMASKSW